MAILAAPPLLIGLNGRMMGATRDQSRAAACREPGNAGATAAIRNLH
jgi:hypothetical protein